ncbi:MAG TPA: YciI family protein [Vicinamibacterales bacterium]|jgi:hypothetical protein|nr:YciI family protein [Vicinamibacterales bacterium]
MKYTLMIYDDEKGGWASLSQTEQQRMIGEYRQFTQQIKDSGQFVAGEQLHPTSAATSVRVRNGQRVVTDGPFAETSEQLGGYFLIDARNLDEAIDIAGRIPSARLGTVEIRPVVEGPSAS